MHFEHNESARERERESTLVTLVSGRAILYITHGLTATGQRGEEITSLLGAWNQRLRNGECIGYLYFYFKSRDSAKNEGPFFKHKLHLHDKKQKSHAQCPHLHCFTTNVESQLRYCNATTQLRLDRLRSYFSQPWHGKNFASAFIWSYASLSVYSSEVFQFQGRFIVSF